MHFVQLVVQLVHFLFGSGERPAASRRDPIEAPAIPCGILRRLEQPGALQSVQQRIESPRSDAVSVMRELLHHRQAEDRPLRRMHENVNANQSVKKLAPMVLHRNQYTTE